MATAHVVLSSGFSRRYTGGAREFDIEAKTMRDVIKALDQLYPGLGEHLEEETTVAIDGEIHDAADLFPEDARRLRDLLHPEARRRLSGPAQYRTADGPQVRGPSTSEGSANGIVSAGFGDRHAGLGLSRRIRSTRRSRSAPG